MTDPNTTAPRTHGETPDITTAIQQFTTTESKSPNYQANTEYVLEGFANTQHKIGNTSMSDLDDRAIASYVTDLDTDSLARSTVWTYFAIISAFLSYCERWGWIEENYCDSELVRDELPAKPTPDSSDQQFWTPEQRQTLLNHVDEQARTAVEANDSNAVIPLRNRALAYLLAYTGVRAGEILSASRDDRRNGVTWGDINIEDNVITVLGKNQNRETVPLPEQVHHPLQQLRRAVSPPDSSWPVIHSNHRPTVYGCLPGDFNREEVDADSPLRYCAAAGVTPPALSVNGGRSVMQRLCEDGDVDVNGYLKPHGGRRGVGEALYRAEGAAAAQRALRHADPRTTSEMYSHIESSELASDVTDVFNND